MQQDVESFIDSMDQWKEEFQFMHHLIMECGLEPEIKWKTPCYTFKGKNILLLGAFKQSCTLSFIKGSLLKDPAGILSRPGENSNEGMVARFTDLEQIQSASQPLRALIFQAIEVEKLGLKPKSKEVNEGDYPQELLDHFKSDPSLKQDFESLTPGRQRGLLLHFNGAKQSKTRNSRIEQSIPRIRMGKGIHDCICGHSKRMPRCDGSHKHHN